MAVKNYRATAKGYVDGRVIEEDEVFATEFKQIAREPAKTDKNGRPVAGAIKRNKDGSPVMEAGDAPSWAVEIDKAEAMAQAAADPNNTDDPNLDAMSKEALQAYAAERNVVFQASTNKADLITAIKAAADPTR
jgi:hypothetical protein